MTHPTIRQAVLADAEGLAQVHVEAWQWAYRGLMPDDFLDSLDPSKRADMWTKIIGDGSSSAPLIALDGEEVVGFCHAGRSRDDDATEQTGEVTAIYLAADHVGTGMGWNLWNAALDQLQDAGCSTVTVWVLDTNERGRAFYERVGMKPDGATKSDDLRGFPITELRYKGWLPGRPIS